MQRQVCKHNLEKTKKKKKKSMQKADEDQSLKENMM